MIQTKLIESDLSIVFDAVQTDGEYTISAENVEGEVINTTVRVTARNVLDTDTITVAVDMGVQLINYTMLLDTTSGALDECVDITGGWGHNVGSVSKTDSGIVLTYTSSSVPIASCESSKTINFSEYSTLCLFNSTTLSQSNNWSINVMLLDKDGNPIKQSEQEFGVYPKTVTPLSIADETGWKTIYSKHHNWDAIDKTSITIRLNAYLSSGEIYDIFFTKADDWQTLLSMAGVSATSLADFFSSASKIATLLSDESAVRIMLKKCTGDFMAQAVASQKFVTALESSPYNELIFDNEHWAKFLGMVGAIPESNKVYLYKDGVENVPFYNPSIVSLANTFDSRGFGNACTLTRERQSDNLYLYIRSTKTDSTGVASWVTSNPVDLTPYSKLKLAFEKVNTSDSVGTHNINLQIRQDAPDGITLQYIGYDAQVTGRLSDGNHTYEMDVSEINALEYIIADIVIYQVPSQNITTTGGMKIRRIWLEK